MKNRVCIVISLLLLLTFHDIALIPTVKAFSSDTGLKVILVYNPDNRKEASYILDAYESVLEEEGVAHESIDCQQLVEIPVNYLVKKVPVIILPDQIIQNVPENFCKWVKKYLAEGGNVALIYDAGVKNKDGTFKEQSVFADIIGLNYITYNTNGVNAYTLGKVKFTSEINREFFQIPLGKTVDRLTLSSYTYGALTYPIAMNEFIRDIPENVIYANGIMENGQKNPLIMITDYFKGKVLYVNLPLGYLKGHSDDLPLRSIIRTFLFDVVGIPHLMNVEQGRGGLVINWHVDADIEHLALPYLFKKGFMRKEIAASFHITAGEFFLKPGDDEGFNAGGAGKHLVLRLKDYGMIGSHGGWAHNWFSENIIKGNFKKKEIRENILRNNECLEKVVGYKITEYSAPNGAHPQPMATKALEDLGIIAYYYAGDTGSVPNRVFYNGKMVSDKVIAFPLMPFGKSGSLWEMRALNKKTDAEVLEWFLSTLQYASDHKTVRMIYSHPYDIQNYPEVITKFLDKVVAMQANGQLTVRPMSYFAEFLMRFLKTNYIFQSDSKQLVVSLENPDGLNDITVALPKREYFKPVGTNIVVREDARYYYAIVGATNEKKKYITAYHR